MIQDTFRWDGKHYISTSMPDALSPVCVIDTALRWRVVMGAVVVFPQNFSQAGLLNTASLNSIPNMAFPLVANTALRLRDVATQLLELNEGGQIRPPFTCLETAVLSHLIEIVPVPSEP